MKHIIHYLGALLAVVLLAGTFTACVDQDGPTAANSVMGIKAFFPTKVVTNQPITINGSGFNGVTEIQFPGGKKVTNLELLKNRLIYLTTLYSDDVFDELEKDHLRDEINATWKEVYYQLGRNIQVPLSDDERTGLSISSIPETKVMITFVFFFQSFRQKTSMKKKL